ncbi:uncharacterized protein [Ptychodera flava]|uniref:uncharacterized protein n=1 Tax=Ptychodera flava TaxID=63121 RepID=UPI00396A7159
MAEKKNFLDFDEVGMSYQRDEHNEDFSEAEEYDLDDFTNEDTSDFYMNHFSHVTRKAFSSNDAGKVLDNPTQSSTLPSETNTSSIKHQRTANHLSNHRSRNDLGKTSTSQNISAMKTGLLNSEQIDVAAVLGIQNVNMLQVDKFFQELDDLSQTLEEESSRTQVQGVLSSEKVAVNGNLSDGTKGSSNGIVEQLTVAKSQFLEAKESLQKLLAPEKQETELSEKVSAKSAQTATDSNAERNRGGDSALKSDSKRKDTSTVKKVRFMQQTRSRDDTDEDTEDGEIDDDLIECFEIDDEIPGESNSDDCKENHIPDGRASNVAILESSNAGMPSNSSVGNTQDKLLMENSFPMLGKRPTVQKLTATETCHGCGGKKNWECAERRDEEEEDSFDSVEQKILEAAIKGKIDILKSSGMSNDEVSSVHDDRGNTLLHITAKHGRMDCLQWLVANGCKGLILHENDDAQTPAVIAIKHGQIECLQWLILESQARKQLILEDNKPVLIHQAARYGQECCLRWLLGYMQMQDLSIDITDLHGNTAVHLAAKYGHLSCLQTLVEFNADVTATNKKGHTPCKVAANHHHDTSAQFLIVVESCISLAEQVTNYRKELREVKQENLVLRSRLDDSLAFNESLIRKNNAAITIKQLQLEYVDLTGKLVKQLDDLYQKKTTHRSRSSSLENSGSEEKLGAEIAASKEKAEALRRRCVDLTEQEKQLKEKEEAINLQEKKSNQKLDILINESAKQMTSIDDNFGLEPLSVMRARLREVSHRLMMYHNAKTVHDREVLATSHDSLSSRSSLSSPTSLSPVVSPRTSVSSLQSPTGTLPRYASYNSLFTPKSDTSNHRRHSDGHKLESYFTEPVKITKHSQFRKDAIPEQRKNDPGKQDIIPNPVGSSGFSMDNQSTAKTHKDLDVDIPCIEVQENTQERANVQNYSMEANTGIQNIPSRQQDQERNSPALSSADNDSVFEEYDIDGIFPGNHPDRLADEAADYVFLRAEKSANQRELIEHVTPANQSQGRLPNHSQSQSPVNKKDIFDSRKTSSPTLSSSSLESFDSGSRKSGQRGSTGSSHSEGLYDSVGSDGKPIPESIPQWILMSNKRGRPEPIIEKIGSSTENLKMIFAKHIPAPQLDMIRRMDECMRKVQPTKTAAVATAAPTIIDASKGVSVWMGKDMVNLPENLAASVDENSVENNEKSKVKLKRKSNKDWRIKFAGLKGNGARNSSDENSVKEMLAPIYEMPAQGKAPEKQSVEDLSGKSLVQSHMSPKQVTGEISGNPKQGKVDVEYEKRTKHGKTEREVQLQKSPPKIPDKDQNAGNNISAGGKEVVKNLRKGNAGNVQNVEVKASGSNAVPGIKIESRTPSVSKPISTPSGIRIIRKESEERNSTESKYGNSTDKRQPDSNGNTEHNRTELQSIVNGSALPIATINGGDKLPFDLSDLPPTDFDGFFSSSMPNEEDAGKAWYESSDEDDGSEPVPRPRNALRKSSHSKKSSSNSREKGNKHIYFL